MTTDVALAGIPGAVLVVALVAAARAAGLPSRWAPLAAAVAGVVVALAAELVVQLPGARGWVEAAAGGLVLGLSATGAYAAVTKAAGR